jgi:hypothetical protein
MQPSHNAESQQEQIIPRLSTGVGAHFPGTEEPQKESKRGRPATLTLELVQKIARLIAKGMTEEQACLRVGVNHATLRTAKHRNPEYETAIKEAQAEYRHGEQFRRNTAIELGGQVGLHSGPDRLVQKPLSQWTRADFDQSLGVWQLLREWPAEKLDELDERYHQVWGDANVLTDDQLAWCVEISRRVAELRGDVAPGTPIREFVTLALGEARTEPIPTPLRATALVIDRALENPEHF